MGEDYVTEADLTIDSAELVAKRTWSLDLSPRAFVLKNGQTLPQVKIAYEIWGTLAPARDKVILIEHGLTSSSHAAGRYAPSNRTVGYLDGLIGPGEVFDTRRFFVIAVNSLGGCRGSTGPAALDPRTGKPYPLTFPVINISDMVRVQEQYLHNQAAQIIKRFDANWLLYLTKAVDLYDLAVGYPGLEVALSRIKAQVLLISIGSDLLFPPRDSERLTTHLCDQEVPANHQQIEPLYGHDDFLVEQHKLLPSLRPFLARMAE